MITDADIKKLRLERFATKEELEKLNARTAEGFSDVQGQLNDIKTDLSNVKEDVSILKQDVSGLKQDVSEIKSTLLDMKDYIYSELHNMRIENKVTATYQPKIEDHEQRITKVESIVFAN
jgi:chromosome segregation ATPase